jgi:hypothetical protein
MKKQGKAFAPKLPKGASFSEDYLAARDTVPQVSTLMAHSVSQARKDMLANEVAAGIYREGNGPSFNATGLTKNSIVSAAHGPMYKRAQVLGASDTLGAGFSNRGGDSAKQIPQIYSPLWLTSNLNLPRDRATINAWCRAFFALNPYVHNAINFHSTYPISKLTVKCPNPEIQKFYDDLLEELDLMNVCAQIAQEYWLLGEAFPYAEWDPAKAKWSRIMLQNPDYMIVKRTVIANEPMIMLRPDENLKRLVHSNRPADVEQRKQLNQHIITSVKRGENIPLDNFHVSHIARKISPYEIRGTGLPVCIFRYLMLYDKIYEAKFTQADQMINPLTLIKVGAQEGMESLHPTSADLEEWRQIFESVEFDPDAKIITHPGVSVERVGYNQGIYDVSNDITQLIKTMQVGLFMPPVLLDGGADTTYANGSVALDALRQRYMQFRNMLAIWLKRKIFAPISKAHGFYDIKDNKKQLIVPEVDWNHMSLFDAGDFISNLITLTQPAGEGQPPPRVSTHTLYRSLGLEWEDEQRKLRKEAIEAEIFRKEAESLKLMRLTELRSLGAKDEDIPEPSPEDQQRTEQPVPGEVGGAPSLDMGGGGGLPGLGTPPGGGGLPPLPTPPPETGPPPTPPPAGGPPAPAAPGGPPPAP